MQSSDRDDDALDIGAKLIWRFIILVACIAIGLWFLYSVLPLHNDITYLSPNEACRRQVVSDC